LRDGLNFKKQDNVPAARDPSWEPLTAPLLDYISEQRRSVDDIIIWGRAQRHTGSLIRHILAWLSFYDKVVYDIRAALWQIYKPQVNAAVYAGRDSSERASNSSPTKNGDDLAPSD
jgi:hypothetical protein